MCKELVRLTTQDVGKGIPITDSLILSYNLEREHSNIQRLILKYQDDINEFGKLGIEIRPLESGQLQKVYLLNEMQATFLITLMRNTKPVLEFKKRLVKAFFFMKNELQVRQETRHIGIIQRKSLTDTIKTKVDDDTNFKKFAYSNYTKLVYKQVLGNTVKKLKEERGLKTKDNLRDFLTIEELEKVQDLESKIATYIEMRKDLIGSDKEIYQEVSKFVKGL